jgi:hypothetical protein
MAAHLVEYGRYGNGIFQFVLFNEMQFTTYEQLFPVPGFQFPVI